VVRPHELHELKSQEGRPTRSTGLHVVGKGSASHRVDGKVLLLATALALPPLGHVPERLFHTPRFSVIEK
jgi:hypothetical protein